MSISDDNIRKLELLASENGVALEYFVKHLEDPELYPIPESDTSILTERPRPVAD